MRRDTSSKLPNGGSGKGQVQGEKLFGLGRRDRGGKGPGQKEAKRNKRAAYLKCQSDLLENSKSGRDLVWGKGKE